MATNNENTPARHIDDRLPGHPLQWEGEQGAAEADEPLGEPLQQIADRFKVEADGDSDAELRATGESKAAVRYVKHSLDSEDIRRHIAAGKQSTRLAMTWNSRVSFVLTESLAIRSIKPLDVIKENETIAYSDEERFDNDIMLMTGELSKLLADLVEALGGEAKG